MTFDERAEMVRFELENCDLFYLKFHNFNLNTMKMLTIINDQFSDKFSGEVTFKFGDEFLDEDI